jgi:nucleotide-binding universal stress UspA family protein
VDSNQRRISQRLHLEGIPLNVPLAKKLPPRLAFGYHMLPLAVEKDQVTVAMADPQNKFAVEAVRSALGVNPYIVKSDQIWIDRLLVELWPDYQNDDLHILLCTTKNNMSSTFNDYAHYIRTFLKVPGSNIYTIVGVQGEISTLVQETCGVVDLVILEESEKSRCLHSTMLDRKFTVKQQIQPSVLVARQPRWPINKILLILRFENRDHVTVDWILKMDLPSNAVVTMLVPLPTVPRMYQGFPEMSIQMPKILEGKSKLGEHLRSIIARFEAHGMGVNVRVLEGTAKCVIQQEVIQEDYDLIAVAAEPEGWLKKRLMSSVVDPVLDYARRPIFIAKPPDG